MVPDGRQGSRRFDMIDSDATAGSPRGMEGVLRHRRPWKDHLTNDDLRDAMFINAERPRSRFASFADRVDRLKVILNGDMARCSKARTSGPGPGLHPHDPRPSWRHRALGAPRQEAVVLIFGSFT